MDMDMESIRSVRIEGFRSLKSVNLELRPFNVLIGANGSGKSNFIEFFRMLNQAVGSTQGNLQLYVARKGGASSVLYYGPRVSRSLDAELVVASADLWSSYEFSLSWGAPDELRFAGERIRTDTGHQLHEARLGSGSLESRLLTDVPDPSEPWRGPAVQTFRRRLKHLRAYHFPDTGDDAAIRLTQDRTREERLLSNGGNLAVLLSNLQQNRPEHYRRILNAVQIIVPFVRDFVLEPQVSDSRFVMLRWMDQSGEVFGPHQLSDGSLRAIALVTALLQPEETMPSVLFFDGPELGLHPTAVGLVADLLKEASRRRQVIVATQSPLLIRSYEPEDIVVVERSPDAADRQQSEFRRLDHPALEAWLEDFDLGELYEKNVTGGFPR